MKIGRIAILTLVFLPDIVFGATWTWASAESTNSPPNYRYMATVATTTQFVTSLETSMGFNVDLGDGTITQSLYMDVYKGDPQGDPDDWEYVTVGIIDDTNYVNQSLITNYQTVTWSFGNGFWMTESTGTSTSWIFLITDSDNDVWDYALRRDVLEGWTGWQSGIVRTDTNATQNYVEGALPPTFSSIPASSSAIIEISDPCEATNKTSCFYGHATTSDPILINGIANPIMSYANGWGVVSTLYDISGNVIDQTSTYFYDSSPNQTFSGVVYWTEAISQLAILRVCQAPIDGTWSFGDEFCANVSIGWELSTASTSEYVVGLIEQGVNPLTEGYGAEQNQNFVPNESLQELMEQYFEDIKTLGPLVLIDEARDYLDEIETGTTSTSTFGVTFDFNRFGISSTTSYVDISGMALMAETLLDCDNESTTCFFEWVDYFLWGLFWIFIFVRTFSGQWIRLSPT